MNNLTININNLPTKELPILTDAEAGEKYSKWSYLNAYYPNVLRDIYLISKSIQSKTKKEITKKVNEFRIKKQDGREWSPWSERYVLEYMNTLKKVGFWDENGNETNSVFVNSKINTPLSFFDKQDLIEVFFTYFRFKELSSWFINTSKEFHKSFDSFDKSDFVKKSKPIYFYSQNSRFNNVFLFNIEKPKTKYTIENDALMRFWDVYIKWGTTLNILDKFNISNIVNNNERKEISMTYFINEFREFNLIEYIDNRFSEKNIWIPQLIFEIAKDFRYPVHRIKEYIVKNINSNDKITFERTSEIFLIKGKNAKRKINSATYLYPLIDDYYISNLIIRK